MLICYDKFSENGYKLMPRSLQKPEIVQLSSPVTATSDLHLGSSYCRHAAIEQMLDKLAAGHTLVLMGDTVDRWKEVLEGRDAALLEKLCKMSFSCKIVWLRGNHDIRFNVPCPNEIIFADGAVVDGKAYLSHGHYFDSIMPRHRIFIQLVRKVHHIKMRLGAESIHVAQYAKRLRWLYHAFLSHVRQNALEYARENGYTLAACGHTHQVEDVTVNGIRYINTGSWTEPGSRCLIIDQNGVCKITGELLN